MLLCPWDFPGKSTGVGCHFLLQRIFLTQGSNPGLLHCRQTLYPLSHQGRQKWSNRQTSIGKMLMIVEVQWELKTLVIILSKKKKKKGKLYNYVPCNLYLLVWVEAKAWRVYIRVLTVAVFRIMGLHVAFSSLKTVMYFQNEC